MISVPFRFVLAALGVALLSGCVGIGGSSPAALTPAPGGDVPQTLLRTPGASLVGLYVTENVNNDIQVLKNGTWTHLGAITNGVTDPHGDWVDSIGNLYVANTTSTVSEYTKGQTTPAFTYSSRLVDPYGLATDLKGDLFVADYDFASGGFVNEYAQKKNAVLHACAVGPSTTGLEGVAVDKAGDVFVGTFSGNVVEFSGGLTGCKGRTLPVSFGLLTGLALDKNRNLLVADHGNGFIDILKPPYSSISTQIRDVLMSGQLSLNAKETKLFVACAGAGDVQVLSYPSGSTIVTITGFKSPIGVSDDPNSVL